MFQGFWRKEYGEAVDGAVDLALAGTLIGVLAVIEPKKAATMVFDRLSTIDPPVTERVATAVENGIAQATLAGQFVSVHADAVKMLANDLADKALFAGVVIGGTLLLLPLVFITDADLDDLGHL